MEKDTTFIKIAVYSTYMNWEYSFKYIIKKEEELVAFVIKSQKRRVFDAFIDIWETEVEKVSGIQFTVRPPNQSWKIFVNSFKFSDNLWS